MLMKMVVKEVVPAVVIKMPKTAIMKTPMPTTLPTVIMRLIVMVAVVSVKVILARRPAVSVGVRSYFQRGQRSCMGRGKLHAFRNGKWRLYMDASVASVVRQTRGKGDKTAAPVLVWGFASSHFPFSSSLNVPDGRKRGPHRLPEQRHQYTGSM